MEEPKSSQVDKTEPDAVPTPLSQPDGEATDGEAAEPEPAEPSLEEQLSEATASAEQAEQRLLRMAADYDNFRKRAARELDETRKRSKQHVISELLPVFDNLERATAHAAEGTEAESMVEGIRIVHQQFLDTLGKMGIGRIEAVGHPFDPTVHESIHQQASSEYAAGVVMSELQPGYRMGEVLVRPSLVVVSSGPPAADPPPSEPPQADGEPDEPS